MTITNDKLAELKRLARQEAAYYKDQWDLGPTLKADGWQHGLAAYLDACAPQTILSLLALAERALEPQGQALPEFNDAVKQLRSALSAMMTQFGMDEDETSAGTFKQARKAYDDTANMPDFAALYGETAVQNAELRIAIGAFGLTHEQAVERASQLALPAGPVPGSAEERAAITNAKTNAAMTPKEKRASDRIKARLAASPSPAVAQPVPEVESLKQQLANAKQDSDMWFDRLQDALKRLEQYEAAQPVSQQFPTKLHLSGAISVLFNQEQKKFHDEQASIDGMLDSWTSWEQHYNNALADFFWPMVGAVAQPEKQ